MNSPTLELLRSHRSIRRYKPEPVPDSAIRAAVEAGQMASTSSSVQPTSVIVVKDHRKRERLAELCGPQRDVAEAGAFLVFLADTRRHRLACERDGLTYDTRLEAFMVSIIDTALMAEKTVIAFEAMGYGICYIGGLRTRTSEVDELLDLPEGVYPLFGLCVGVPDEQPSKRPRLPVEAVLFEDRYPDDDKLLNIMSEYDEQYCQYLKQRGAKTIEGWSERMAKKFAKPERADLAAYYRGKGARLD